MVSIIIPTYNRANLLVKTLLSVQAQTYQNWECIVVDDFSTDNTKEVIYPISLTDKRISYVQNQHLKGAPGSRNTGLEYSKGEFVSFLDSDDILLPDYITNKLKYFIQDEHLDLVISLSKRIENGNETCYINVPAKTHPLVRFYSLYPIADIPWINSTLIKKAFLFKNKISWDETVKRNQDIQFNVKMLSRNPSFIWSTEEFDNYWVYDSNLDNIGSFLYDEVETTKKLIEVYWDNLQYGIVDSQLKKKVKRQYHAQLISFCDRLSNNVCSNQDFFRFMKNKSHFSFLDIIVLKKRNRFIRKLPVSLKERIYWKMIRMYFEVFYPPVLQEGNYLKHKTI